MTPNLKKEITPLSLRETIYLITLLLLPNLIFIGASLYAGVARPLFNLDYFFALFFILLPYKVTRFVGTCILVFALLFDAIMFVIQIFPFMNLSAIRYLFSFILDAPDLYLFILAGAIFVIISIIILFIFLSKKIKQPYPSFILIIVLIISYVLMILDISYTRFNGILGRDNYYIAHSQISLYLEETKSEFSKLMSTKPQLSPLAKNEQRALDIINQPYPPKILLIIAESLGAFKDAEIHEVMLKNILEQQNHFEKLSTGSLFTIGATVSGELRELCSLKITNNGFALGQSKPKIFKNCFPNQLQQQNYKTIAMHGASGLLYDRTKWYPKAGFQEVFFGEHLIGLPRCSAFKGVCDDEMIDVIAKKFEENAKNKLFLYWLSLTAHYPYAQQDIRNQRLDCKRFAINPNSEVCRNAKLQTQLFDDLAQLIQKKEMQGVEVIVVGDHHPPIWGDDNQYIRPLNVSYLHFKIK